MGAAAPIDFEKSLIAPIDFDEKPNIIISFDNFHVKMEVTKKPAPIDSNSCSATERHIKKKHNSESIIISINFFSKSVNAILDYSAPLVFSI